MNARTVLLAFALAGAIVAQTDEGQAFRVHVVNSITGVPIASANVVLENMGDAKIWGTTDAGGIFTGRTQTAGKNVLTVQRRGYRMSGTGPMGKIIDIQPGAQNEITIQLQPLGVIAGRVVDQYGDPVRGAIVRDLRKRTVPVMGDIYEGSSAATTNDRGEYRVPDIEPGKCFVVAEYGGLGGALPTRLRWPEAGGYALLPDTTDIDRARQVEVVAGATTRVVDLQLKILPDVKITGHVTPAPQQGTVSLSLRPAGTRLPLNVFAGRGGRTEPDGSFQYNVLPGRYLLSASDRTGRVSKEIEIDAHSNVTGVELSLDTRYEVQGRIVVDGDGSLDFSKIRLNFLGADAKIAKDGSFHTTTVPGKARCILQWLPDGWYIKDFSVGGQRVTGSWFEVKSVTTDVSIVVSSRGATVQAKLAPGSSLLEAGIVILLPEDGPIPEVELTVHLQVDDSGNLVAHSVPPGSYRVFALDATNFAYIMNPAALMEKYGKSAPVVQIAEGEHKIITVQPTKIQPEQ